MSTGPGFVPGTTGPGVAPGTTGPAVDFGIAGLGVALGAPQDVRATAARYVPDPDRVLRWGYESYHRLDDEVSTTAFAAAAARAALARAEAATGQVDMLVLASSTMPEYQYWDPSAALSRELALGGAPTLSLTQGCLSGTAAFATVAGVFAVRPEVDTVLLVVVNRVSEFHRNRMKTNSALSSDGAVGAVLRRGHPRCRWLATEQLTDPELCDWFRLDFGGSVQPVPPAGWSNLDNDSLGFIRAHFGTDVVRFTRFFTELTERTAEVVERACRRAGVPRTALARLYYLNDNQNSLRMVARAVGVPEERTNAALARTLGHLGAADQLVCLERQLAAGELADGDLVALAGLSSGLHWFCTLLRV